jgi:hypothetical protein
MSSIVAPATPTRLPSESCRPLLCHVQLRRSTVVGAKGESVVDSYRTSYGMFIR